MALYKAELFKRNKRQTIVAIMPYLLGKAHFACVVFGLSGFPSRKENGLLSSRFLREKQND